MVCFEAKGLYIGMHYISITEVYSEGVQNENRKQRMQKHKTRRQTHQKPQRKSDRKNAELDERKRVQRYQDLPSSNQSNGISMNRNRRRHVRWDPNTIKQDQIPRDSPHLNTNALEHVLYCHDCQYRISEEEDRIAKLEEI